MEINLSRLHRDGEDFAGEERPSILEIDEKGFRALGALRYSLRVQLVSGELIARGRLAMDLECQCCRCAEFFRRAVENDDFCAVRAVSAAEESVDLTPELREAILLAFPSYPVCRTDCAGLCARCGADLNRGACSCRPAPDGRWEALGCWEEKEGAATE